MMNAALTIKARTTGVVITHELSFCSFYSARIASGGLRPIGRDREISLNFVIPIIPGTFYRSLSVYGRDRIVISCWSRVSPAAGWVARA
jgi:hypothetical protein